jgi:hypothetical protein
LEIIEFGEHVLTETAPLSGIYKMSIAVPEYTFPYVMHRDSINDATLYKMYIVRGDDVDVLAMDKPIGTPDTAVTIAKAGTDDVDYVGRRRINGTVVNTEVIGRGMVTLGKGIITMGDKVYTVDLERGLINNK